MYLRTQTTMFAIYALLLMVFSPLSNASMVVLYPKVSSPYSEIFSEIIAGVEEQHTGNIELQPISKTQSIDELSLWVKDKDPDMLIALGRGGYNLVKSFYKDKPVVVGALPIKPNGISGISLLGDPKVLFNSLQTLTPHIQRVHVVYSDSSEWLIQLAEMQSAALGLTLIKVKVQDIKVATQEYDKLLSLINVKTDAIWLPLDPVTANEQIILPSLLEQTWEKNIVLFSSKPAHAKRGALFSMFPNNYELGKQLAVMVESMHKTKMNGGVLPLNSMRLAVNLRTASHLGLEYKNSQKQQFYITYP